VAQRFTQATLDAMPEQICVLDGTGRILFVNAGWRLFSEANHGTPASTLVGSNYLDACAKASGPGSTEAAPFLEGLHQVLAGTLPSFSLEYPCHSPRVQRWFLARVTRYAEGGFVRLVVAHQDISALKAAHEAQRLTAERFEAALADSPVVIFHQDRDLRYTWIHNPALSYRAAEVIGLRDGDIFERPEDAAATEALKRQVLESGVRQRREVLIRDAGVDRFYDLTVDPHREATGEVTGVLCVAVEVTERKQSERNLSESEGRFRDSANLSEAVIEFSPYGMILYDASGQCVRANGSAARILGATTADLLQQNYHSIRSWRSSGMYRLALDAMERDATTSDTLEILTSFGRPLTLELRFVPLVLGGRRHLLLNFVDVANYLRVQKELAAKGAELERSNAELQLFADVASHDLQEPLRMVASYTELLGERYRGRLDEKADKYIGYAVDGARRMQLLINDLLAFSRVGTRVPALELVKVSEVLDAALGNLALALRESGGEVHRSGLPAIVADRRPLVQLFQNLLGNALKFRGEAPPRIEVSAARQAQEWTFCVRDNGIGLDMKFADRIFRVFQRLHGREQYPGSGMGLAICKKIVERQGGRMWVASELGRGSAFYFTLPEAGGRGGGRQAGLQEGAEVAREEALEGGWEGRKP
jgi:PAS domain S-box-containing protein